MMITIPHLSQLHYAIFDGHPPLEPLRILREQTVQWSSWRVTFCVLGASHAVRFSRGDDAFTEMLACLPPDAVGFADASRIIAIAGIADTVNHEHGRLLRVSANAEDNRFVRFGLTHHVEIARHPLDDNWLTGKYGANEIAHAFPADPALRLPDPVTRVGWAVCGASLRIETLHSYPEEALALRTLSVFEEQGDNRK